VLLEGWFQLASTAGFQRLAVYLPGLVCPYRQVGLFSMTREAYPSDLLLWLGDCCASKSALLTNFGESPTVELSQNAPSTPSVNEGNSPHLRVGGVSTALLAGCPEKAFGFINHR